MSVPEYHKRGADAIRADRVLAVDIERRLDERFVRWNELEVKAGAK